MERALDFTVAEEFGGISGLADFYKHLNEKGMHFILIFDPAICTNPYGESNTEYPALDIGWEKNIFIKHSNPPSSDGTIKPDESKGEEGFPGLLTGIVWPGLEGTDENGVPYPPKSCPSAWPDYFKESTVDWWVEELEKFYDLVPYDGIWIDMNEPSNFQDGSFQGCPDNTLENPPFVPKMSCECGDMVNKTICMSSIQYPFGENEEPVNHYDAHSLYGHSMSSATKVAVDRIYGKQNKRSWMITRSSFVGSGKYTGHWLGDNYGTEAQMQSSIK